MLEQINTINLDSMFRLFYERSFDAFLSLCTGFPYVRGKGSRDVRSRLGMIPLRFLATIGNDRKITTSRTESFHMHLENRGESHE